MGKALSKWEMWVYSIDQWSVPSQKTKCFNPEAEYALCVGLMHTNRHFWDPV